MTSSLTREQVLAEPAGTRLDAWVAEHVMGIKPPFGYSAPPADGFWSHERTRLLPTVEAAAAAYAERGLEPDHHDYLCYWKEGWGPLALYEYSQDIADAWLVVEEMRHGRDFDCYIWAYRDSSMAAFGRSMDGDCDRAEDGPIPLLICRAALLAVLPPPGAPVGSASTKQKDDHDDDDQRFG